MNENLNTNSNLNEMEEPAVYFEEVPVNDVNVVNEQGLSTKEVLVTTVATGIIAYLGYKGIKKVTEKLILPQAQKLVKKWEDKQNSQINVEVEEGTMEFDADGNVVKEEIKKTK